jgi:hypothetical protein
MRLFGLFLAALPCAAAPLMAQDAPAAQRAFSPEEDLDCAMYVGALMAESEAELTPESRVALTSAFTYFTGRYEAQRGTGLIEAFTSRYPVYAASEPTALAQTCSVRMRSFGARLEQAGRVMAELQLAAPEGSDPEGQ